MKRPTLLTQKILTEEFHLPQQESLGQYATLILCRITLTLLRVLSSARFKALSLTLTADPMSFEASLPSILSPILI